jgi:pimeloyl-ACP methyl ester carboxylesterase
MNRGQRSVPARDGLPLAYGDGGAADGPTLVLLHSLGADRAMWEPCADLLGHDHRLLIPDSRGHGASGDATAVSVDQWVDDLEDVLDNAGAGEVLLVGVSLGGIQALAFASAHPGRVLGLVVADSFAGLPQETAQTKIENLRNQALSQPMDAVADQYLADTFQQPYPAGAEAVRRSLAGMDPGSYVAAVEACFGVQIEDRLTRISSPALVLWGDRDAKTPRHLSERIVDGLHDARLAVIPDAGHLSNLDNPDAYATAVRAFSAACGARPVRVRAEGGI